LKNLLAELDARVERIVINDLRENTFFARIHLTRGGNALSVDSRPSDALLGASVEAEIFVEEEVLERAEPAHRLGQDPVSEVARRGGDELGSTHVVSAAAEPLAPKVPVVHSGLVIISIANQKEESGRPAINSRQPWPEG
jgi:hypothetical protein